MKPLICSFESKDNWKFELPRVAIEILMCIYIYILFSHNHGSVEKVVVFKRELLLEGSIFPFHDYGKGNTLSNTLSIKHNLKICFFIKQSCRH